MLTLKELKEQVNRPRMARVPGFAELSMRENPLVRLDLAEDTFLCVFPSGYAQYKSGKRFTVFSVFEGKGYCYLNGEEQVCIEESFFDMQEWYVRLLLVGEDHLTVNAEHRQNEIFYGDYTEEWSVLSSENDVTAEPVMVRDQIRELMSYMTERQRDIVYRFYFQGQSFVEIAEDLNIGRRAVKDALDKAARRAKRFAGSNYMEE